MPDPVIGGFQIIKDVKILVVDDDSLVRKLTVTALSYCVNREVLSFEDGMGAWNYIKDDNPVDIVISDVDMPKMGGFNLMEKVRQKDPEKIFILMSGVKDYEELSRNNGASAFLAKPFEISDLFNIIQCFVVDQPE